MPVWTMVEPQVVMGRNRARMEADAQGRDYSRLGRTLGG
jgi:hypothetical protein